jgi:outer membrane protein
MKFFIFFFIFFYVSAQKVLNLNDCIKIAKQNNPSLQQLQISQDTQNENIKLTKAKKLPNLSFQSSNSYQFGFQSNLIGTNEIAQSYSNANGLSSQVIIYQGKTLQLQHQKAKETLNNLKLSEKNQDLELSLQVVQLYYSVLMQEQMLKSQQVSMLNSEKNYERLKKLYFHQSQSHKELNEFELNFEKEKQRMLQTEYQLLSSKQKLKEVLILHENFTLSPLLSEVGEKEYSLEKLTEQVVKNHPKIKQSQSDERLKKYDLQLAKNSWLPSITARYGLNVNYLDFFNRENESYFTQIWNNQNQMLSLQLTFPIFDNYQFRSSVKISKNALKIQQIEHQKLEQELKNQIESLLLDYQNSLKNYKLQKNIVSFSEKRLNYTEVLFFNESISVYDYWFVQNEHEIQEIESIQLQYQLLFKQKVIDLISEGFMR